MSAAAEQMTDMQLPGGFGSPSVSHANDQQLKQCLADDLEHIRVTTDPEKPDKDGMAPAAWKERARGNRSMQNNLASVERAERRIVAIREELDNREAARKAEADERDKRAEKRLAELVEKGPKDAQRLRDMAEELMPGVDRVRQLVKDIEGMAQAAALERWHSMVCDGTERAAGELDMAAPKLAELPEGLPDRSEFQRAAAMLADKHSGFDTRPGVTGDYAKAHEIAQDRK